MCIAMITFAACESTNEPQRPGVTPEEQPENPTDKGGLDNPYSVADILEMKTNGTLPAKDAGTDKAWVEAYIVGSYNFDADPKFVIGTENAVNSSLLLADDAESVNTEAIASVQLAAGVFRTQLNLLDNPTNYKQKIKLYGVIETYCGIGGIVKIEQAYLNDVKIELPSADVEGEGTEENPYSVSDIISMNTAGSIPSTGTQKAWIEAYIVGSYNFNNNPKFVIGVNNASNTSLLLADDAENTNTDAIASLQLAAGIYRVQLNIADNPANYKKKLKVYGLIQKYCGIGGMVNIEKAYLDGAEIVMPETEEPQNVQQITIAEFLKLEDAKTLDDVVYYELTGTIGGSINTTYGNFDLTDETGTVPVYGLTKTYQPLLSIGQASNDKSYASIGLKAGDKVTIRGTKYTYEDKNNNTKKIEVLGAYFVSKK